jgi:hypothetical protein
MELKRANPLAFHQLLARTCVYLGRVSWWGSENPGTLKPGKQYIVTRYMGKIDVRDEAEDATAEDNKYVTLGLTDSGDADMILE